jgi:hypothetical protein
LRLIDGAPFSKQADTLRGVLLPMMLIGGIVIVIAVGLQYLLVFRSPMIVIMTTAVFGTAAYLLARICRAWRA